MSGDLNSAVFGLTVREILNRNRLGQVVSTGAYRKDTGSYVKVVGTEVVWDSVGCATSTELFR